MTEKAVDQKYGDAMCGKFVNPDAYRVEEEGGRSAGYIGLGRTTPATIRGSPCWLPRCRTFVHRTRSRPCRYDDYSIYDLRDYLYAIELYYQQS